MIMRRCTAKHYRRTVSGKYETVEITGSFHQFAPKYDEFEAGPGNHTVAIVEDQDGQVWECAVSTVKFLEAKPSDSLSVLWTILSLHQIQSSKKII